MNGMKQTVTYVIVAGIIAFLLFSPSRVSIGKGFIAIDSRVYTYERLLSDISYLEEKFADILKVEQIGTSHFGRKIHAIKLGRGTDNILVVGAHHGREWLSTMIMMKMIDTYAAAYTEQVAIEFLETDIFNDISIWFIPMLNPDGVTIQQGMLNQFPLKHRAEILRMNEGWFDFSRWKANGLGIDLNRQYPAGWKKLNKEPSSPYYQFYRGPQPLVAREVNSLIQFTKKEQPLIAVAYHTAGREIYWQYKNGMSMKRDWKIAKKLSFITNYQLAKPNRNAVGGGYTDWFITTFKRPGFTIELSFLVGETNPPISVFKEEWSRNQLVGLLLAHEAKEIWNERNKQTNSVQK